MPTLTPGNRLYFYHLLSANIGVQHQTLIEKAEDVIASDGIDPADVGLSSNREILEALSDFVEIITFRHGNTYVIVHAVPSWDELLERQSNAAATSAASAAGASANASARQKQAGAKASGAKSTGRQRKGSSHGAYRYGTRELKPERPHAKKRKAEATDKLASSASTADVQTSISPQENDVVAPDSASQATPATVGASPETILQDESQAKAQSELLAKAQEEVKVEAQIEIPLEAPADALLEVQVELQNDSSVEVPLEPAAEKLNDSDDGTDKPADKPAGEPAGEIPEAAQLPDAPRADFSRQDSPSISSPEPEDAGDLGEAKTAPSIASASAQENHDAIRKNAQEDNRGLVSTRQGAQTGKGTSTTVSSNGKSSTIQESDPKVGASQPQLQWDLPQDFGRDVHCTLGALAILSKTLPLDADIARTLDEDWRLALSTGSFSGTHSNIVFPLRYFQEDGHTPVQVTIQRRPVSKAHSGKRWQLTQVDGDDGSADVHEASGIEGFARASEGAWEALSPHLPSVAGNTSGGDDDAFVSPVRQLTKFAVIGTWHDFLASLARAAAPEPWDTKEHAGDGAARAGSGTNAGSGEFAILREYITMSFWRAMDQHKVAISPDRSRAAFNTGLLSPSPDWNYVHCLFEARKGEPAWQFSGFTASDDNLFEGQVLEPADFLGCIHEALLGVHEHVQVDAHAIYSSGLGNIPSEILKGILADDPCASEALDQIEEQAPLGQARVRAFGLLARLISSQSASLEERLERAISSSVQTALRLAQASYRVAAPAFDPRTRRAKLLLPLYVPESTHAIGAVVLDPHAEPSCASPATEPTEAGRGGAEKSDAGRDGAKAQNLVWHANAIASLADAYACARCVSSELPAWLRSVVNEPEK